MPDVWDTLKLVADPTRLRILYLLRAEELSVAELQGILEMGQSRISTHIKLLKQANLLQDRRDGKRTYYALRKDLAEPEQALIVAACDAAAKSDQAADDFANMERIVTTRREAAERYFNEIAERLGRKYCPGRSWQALGHMMLLFAPKLDIADLGAGEGAVSHLLAKRARHVYCVDSSPRMVEVGTEVARRHGIENLTYIRGDLMDVPLEDCSVDIAILSQALHHARDPEKAISEAARILRPGGRVAILDLKEHTFEKARDLYADHWLGFRESSVAQWLRNAGLDEVEVNTVAKEAREPFFEIILGTGVKAA